MRPLSPKEVPGTWRIVTPTFLVLATFLVIEPDSTLGIIAERSGGQNETTYRLFQPSFVIWVRQLKSVAYEHTYRPRRHVDVRKVVPTDECYPKRCATIV